ncbi:hypothetical protein [Marivirga harenae]|uniref:hypothetical protein n=1 Tax=Marivirga harenae TaxID=2010992 RepID=UPI0026DF0181|nr:hypothetical protein [Marivirga harenae]WKV13947.1 hypothetical protein Q3Y49_08910 [Marivirga harenae]|tara:strand:+ start:264580 stop:265287 length:708 start_codon:yes stop_codon:yes gene_type:complete
MKKILIYIVLTALFLSQSFAQISFLPEPRLDVNFQTGIMIVNPDKASFLYRSDLLLKDRLDFDGQKEFGPSPYVGFEILYPSSDKVSIGIDFNYVKSTAFARYRDGFGNYDLSVYVNYISYKFIPRFNFFENKRLTLFAQPGIGAGLVREKVEEEVTKSSFFLSYQDDGKYSRDRLRTLFGLVVSAKAGASMQFDRLNFNSKVGYEISSNFEGDNNRSFISGVIINFGIGYNVVK